MPSAIPRQNAFPCHTPRSTRFRFLLCHAESRRQDTLGRKCLRIDAPLVSGWPASDQPGSPGGPIPKSRFNTLGGNSQNIFPGNGKRSRSHLPRREPRSNNEYGRPFSPFPMDEHCHTGRLQKPLASPRPPAPSELQTGRTPFRLSSPVTESSEAMENLSAMVADFPLKKPYWLTRASHHP